MDYSWCDEMMDATSRPDYECDECRLDADPDYYVNGEEEQPTKTVLDNPYYFGEVYRLGGSLHVYFEAGGVSACGYNVAQAFKSWKEAASVNFWYPSGEIPF